MSRGGPGCERLRLKGFRRTVAWERGLQAQREEEAGRWREGFWGVGRLRRLDAKGPRPMHPDAACGVRTHWRRPFPFPTE